MSSINYNEFQAGQGVSAPALNENFTLTNNAIENLELTMNSAITSITSTTNLKANKNGSSSEQFYAADATEDTQVVNLRQLNGAALTLTGSVIWYAGNSAPTGYLLCDGSDVSREIYADLFDVIGVKYGAGDSTTTFTLPNLIGKFAEGALSSGTYKNAGLPNIIGSLWLNVNSDEDIGGNVYGAFTRFPIGNQGGADDGDHSTQYTFDANNGAQYWNSSCAGIYGGSTTVQPASLTLLPCIKY